jgi:hypothetical protein
MSTNDVAAEVSVSWGNDIDLTIRLTPRNWARVLSGKKLSIRGNGYHSDGEFFWDYWSFGGGREGSLLVSYGDGGVGFDGSLADATINEFPVPMVPPKNGSNVGSKTAPKSR